MSQVTLIAQFQAKPGLEETLKQELLALVPQTHSEEGCVDYILHESPDTPGAFIFYENWVDQAALDEHAAKPYIEALLGKADDLLAEPPVLSKWSMIAGR